MPSVESQSWLLWAICSAVFAALTAIFAKIGVEGISSDLATFIRTLVIVMVLGTLLVVTRQFEPLGSISPRPGSSWVSRAWPPAHPGSAIFALKFGDAARVAPVDKFSVVIVAIIGVGLLGEHLSARNWVGVVLIGSGVVLAALN